MPAGSFQIVPYFSGFQDQKLNFAVTQPATCSTPNGLPFSCTGGGTVEASGSGQAAMVKVVAQPWEGFQYYLSAGAGSFSVAIPSVTVTNTLSGGGRHAPLAGGLRAVVVPDTIVSPAVAVDAGFSGSWYPLDQISGASTGGIDDRLTILNEQVAVETSHLFCPMGVGGWKFDPYGGVEWVRYQTDLKDLSDGSHAGGLTDVVTPFAGIRIGPYPHEGVFGEASFVDGYHYAGGLYIQF
jgi:hypothetical protein